MLLPFFLCVITLVICFVCLIWEIQQRNPKLIVAFSAMLLLMCWLTFQFGEMAIEQHNNRIRADALVDNYERQVADIFPASEPCPS